MEYVVDTFTRQWGKNHRHHQQQQQHHQLLHHETNVAPIVGRLSLCSCTIRRGVRVAVNMAEPAAEDVD